MARGIEMRKHLCTVDRHAEGRRIDVLIRKLLPALPLGALYRLLRIGAVRVNGHRVNRNYRVAIGDRVTLSRMREDEGSLSSREGYHIDGARDRYIAEVGTLCFESDDILALNKRRGARLFGNGGCQEAIRHYLADECGAWGVGFAPSLLHRLDRNSSGILCASKSLSGARRFSALLAAREIEKEYIALFDGVIERKVVWRERLSSDSRARVTVGDAQGAEATTVVQPLFTRNMLTPARVTLHSGRRHQIRAHGALHAHPLCGDVKYHSRRHAEGYFLHAMRMRMRVSKSAPRKTRERTPQETRERTPQETLQAASQEMLESAPQETSQEAPLFEEIVAPLSDTQIALLARALLLEPKAVSDLLLM